MIVPLVWWYSPYDHQSHAFPAAQATDPHRSRLEAFCHHTAAPTTLIQRDIGDPCPACLLASSNQLALPAKNKQAQPKPAIAPARSRTDPSAQVILGYLDDARGAGEHL